MMAGLQGASVMLLKSKLVPPDRFALAYDLFESTSPPPRGFLLRWVCPSKHCKM
jgi:hypothetical protein